MDNNEEILEEVETVETEETESKEVDYQAEAKKLAEEKIELEKKLQTALIQKQKKDEKLKSAVDAASNNDVSEIKAELEMVKFQIMHKDLDESEIKILQRFRQNGQSLEDVLNDEDVKEFMEAKRMKKEMDDGIPSFSNRSSSTGVKGMSNLESKLAENLPPGYSISKKK